MNMIEKLARISDSDERAVSVGLAAVAASIGGAVLIGTIAF